MATTYRETVRTSTPGRERGRRLLLLLAALAVSTVILVPLAYGILGGFKSSNDLAENPLGWPETWVTSNYTDILESSEFWMQVWNSVLIAFGTTFLVVAFGSMAAFVLARYAFRGREAWFMLFAVGFMFPPAVAILPLFVTLRELGLLNNQWGVILPQAAFGLPITIIILRSFFRAVPGEIEEAAIIEGATPFTFFWRILLPMARPALATVSVLAVVTSWNNFLLPLVILRETDLWTIPLGVMRFQGQYASDTTRVLAYVMLAMAPALLFYAFAERHLIKGLTAGSTKG